MNKAEASAIAEEYIQNLRSKPYSHCASQVGQTPVTTTVIRGGTTYQVQVMHHWDSEQGGAVRVIVAVDDGGFRAFVPLTADFIKAPDGHFVGE